LFVMPAKAGIQGAATWKPAYAGTGAHGGGIYLSNSTMQIKNCTFSNNTALESGGAIFANSGAIKLKFTAFINNMSNTGAGVSLYGADNLNNPNRPSIVNSFFYNNHAVDEGAGIYIANAANVSILNSVFTGNTLSGTNSSGAGIYTDNKSYPAIANCTFYNNTSVSSGGGVTLSAGRIGNSIFKGNSASANPQINIEGAPANSTVFREFMSSIIEGGFQGTQIYDLEPVFASPDDPLGDDGLWGTPDDGLVILETSPNIDSGITYINTEKSDLLGYPRFSNNMVDYGAYEYQRLNSDYQQILEELRSGGYLIVFRHGATDHSQADQNGYREDLENCSIQRNLSQEGIDQTKFVGNAIRLLDIPFDTALTSPMCRCYQTAENIAGVYIKTPVWMGIDSNYTQARREGLGTSPRPGTNTIIVTHMNSMEEVTTFLRTEYQEGDAIIIRPLGGTDFEEVAHITTDTWEKMINYLPESPTSINDKEITPSDFVLYDNYPNPFNPVTNIQFSIPAAQHVTLRIYNAIGQQVAMLVDEFKSAGIYRVQFDASGMSSGVYFYSINAGSFNQTKKLTVIK
ncbi:MAG: T9SS type A sorting domain-containing protein, partial [Ignavibacteriaceae bacterium]